MAIFGESVKSSFIIAGMQQGDHNSSTRALQKKHIRMRRTGITTGSTTQ